MVLCYARETSLGVILAALLRVALYSVHLLSGMPSHFCLAQMLSLQA